MNAYISEVRSVIKKWTEDNAGTPPSKSDVMDAFAEGFKNAEEQGFIRVAPDGDGYEVVEL